MNHDRMNRAIEQLAENYMSVEDYELAIRSEQIVPWDCNLPGGDFAFARAHPDHPMNFMNRGRRMSAADDIMRLAKEDRCLFSSEALEKIHYHLLDCSGAVRLSLASALFLSGNETSLLHLQRLIEMESSGKVQHSGSDMVQSVAELGVKRLTVAKTASISDTVLIVSPDIELVEEVDKVCTGVGLNLWISEPDSPDIIAVGYKIGIIDCQWLGSEMWASFISFLRESKGEQHEHLLIIIEQVEQIEDTMTKFGDLHEPTWVLPPGYEDPFLEIMYIDPILEVMKEWHNSRKFIPPH